MSHEITRTDSLVLNSGQPAWHGLGTVVDQSLTPSEAVRMVLPWEPAPVPVYQKLVLPSGITTFREIPGYKANERDDTRDILGIVSDSYQIVPNKALADFAEALVGADAAVQVETAGSLMGGKRVFLLCKLPTSLRVTPDDETHYYTLFANAHDGTGAVFVLHTAIRVVCNNTFSAALGANFSSVEDAASSGRAFRFRHTGNVLTRVEEARRILGVATTQSERFSALAHAMRDKPLTDSTLALYWRAAYVSIYGERPTDPKLVEHAELWDERLRERATEWTALLNSPTNTLPGMSGTLWAAFNALTEWHDHQRSATRVTGDRRTHSKLFGEAARDKRAALTCALSLLSV